MVRYFLGGLQTSDEHAFSLTKDIKKITMFGQVLSEPTLSVFGILAGRSAFYVSSAIFCCLIIYLFFNFYIPQPRGFIQRFRYILESFIMAFLLFMLSIAPLLVATNATIPWTRSIFAPAVIMISIPLAILYRLSKFYLNKRLTVFVIILISVMSFVSWLGTYQNILKTAVNLNTELNFIRQSCNIKNLEKKEKILLITAKDWYIKDDLWGDFQFTATSDAHACISGLWDAVFAEHGLKRPSLVVYASKDTWQAQMEYLLSANKALLVDMNMVSLRRKLDEVNPWLVRVTASAGNPYFLFDKDTKTPWQVSGSLSYWIRFEFGEPQELNYYVFRADGFPDLAPMNWRLLASSDGFDWKVMDERKEDRASWDSSASRVYIISHTSSNKYYKFVLEGFGKSPLRLNEIVLGTNSKT